VVTHFLGECDLCENEMPECHTFETSVKVDSIYGECGEECGIYTCGKSWKISKLKILKNWKNTKTKINTNRKENN